MKARRHSRVLASGRRVIGLPDSLGGRPCRSGPSLAPGPGTVLAPDSGVSLANQRGGGASGPAITGNARSTQRTLKGLLRTPDT